MTVTKVTRAAYISGLKPLSFTLTGCSYNNINLSGAVASGTKQRQVYTWNNNGMKYQVTWKPSDPNFIRLQVTQPNGKLILNRLLKAVKK